MIITAENICSREMEGTRFPRTFQHSTNKFKQNKQGNYITTAENLKGILGNTQVDNAV
jgi:hypothetical protein